MKIAKTFLVIVGICTLFFLIFFSRLHSETYPDPSQPVLVLILTYMRSGSSLTGDILQHSPGAFYVYEPFRSLDIKMSPTFTVIYANGSERKPPFSFEDVSIDGLYNWFTCNISKTPVIGLMDEFMKCGIKSKMFPLCYEKQKNISQTSAIQICAGQLQDVCLDSPFRIIKTIRTRMDDVQNLLEALPHLKMIHLVRDPRAALKSRTHFGICISLKDHIGCTNRFCTKLENDILEKDKLLKRYPDRIMTVRYEDIARQPLETSKKMYDFIGANFTLEAQQYIYNITMAGKKDNCPTCTTRSNSSAHIDSWKKTMKRKFIEVVNKRCKYVLKHYGFD